MRARFASHFAGHLNGARSPVNQRRYAPASAAFGFAMLALSLAGSVCAVTCPNGAQPPCPPPRPTNANAHHRPPVYSAAYTGPRNHVATPAHKPATFTAVQKQHVVPHGPGPLQGADHSQRNTLVRANGSVTRSDKAALNPQPIPPGHAMTTGHSLATPSQHAGAPKVTDHPH